MTAAALIGIWLWNASVIKQVWGIPIGQLVVALLVTVILVRSTGAWGLLAMGIVILFVAKWFRTSLLLLFLIMTISSYLYVEVSGNFSGDQIISIVTKVVNEERAGSLKFRFDNEKFLSDRARQRMIFGWGGWGRGRVFNEWGKDISTTDSLWILAFSNNGAVGVISLTASLLLPALWFLQRYPAAKWHNRKVAPTATLAVLLALYMLDCILNSMINPIYILACGGITGLTIDQTKTSNQVTGVRLSVAENYLVQQRQQQKNLLKGTDRDYEIDRKEVE